jgi:hypothetical protein
MSILLATVLYDGIDLPMFTYSLRYWRFQLALQFLVHANLTKWGG